MAYSCLRIREIRENRRESGMFIAQILGISPQYYYDLEKGKRNLSTEIAAKLATHFGVSVDYLLGRTDKNKTSQNITDSSEITEVLKIFQNRPEIKELFEIAKNTTTEEVQKTIRIIEALKDK